MSNINEAKTAAQSGDLAALDVALDSLSDAELGEFISQVLAGDLSLCLPEPLHDRPKPRKSKLLRGSGGSPSAGVLMVAGDRYDKDKRLRLLKRDSRAEFYRTQELSRGTQELFRGLTESREPPQPPDPMIYGTW